MTNACTCWPTAHTDRCPDQDNRVGWIEAGSTDPSHCAHWWPEKYGCDHRPRLDA